jgi:hypothetical protein
LCTPIYTMTKHAEPKRVEPTLPEHVRKRQPEPGKRETIPGVNAEFPEHNTLFKRKKDDDEK